MDSPDSSTLPTYSDSLPQSSAPSSLQTTTSPCWDLCQTAALTSRQPADSFRNHKGTLTSELPTQTHVKMLEHMHTYLREAMLDDQAYFVSDAYILRMKEIETQILELKIRGCERNIMKKIQFLADQEKKIDAFENVLRWDDGNKFWDTVEVGGKRKFLLQWQRMQWDRVEWRESDEFLEGEVMENGEREWEVLEKVWRWDDGNRFVWDTVVAGEEERRSLRVGEMMWNWEDSRERDEFRLWQCLNRRGLAEV